jgi:membrane peptidoglycan carboxypeptidase
VIIARNAFFSEWSGRIWHQASRFTNAIIHARLAIRRYGEHLAQVVQRNLGEAILAVRVTQRYSKDEILQRYLNEINYSRIQARC